MGPLSNPDYEAYILHDREQDDRTELFRLLIEAEADPTFISSQWHPKTSLAHALHEMSNNDSTSMSPEEVIPSISKYLRLHRDSHIMNTGTISPDALRGLRRSGSGQ
jgi:hypothetical protein